MLDSRSGGFPAECELAGRFLPGTCDERLVLPARPGGAAEVLARRTELRVQVRGGVLPPRLPRPRGMRAAPPVLHAVRHLVERFNIEPFRDFSAK